jgi:hypothetical protein
MHDRCWSWMVDNPNSVSPAAVTGLIPVCRPGSYETALWEVGAGYERLAGNPKVGSSGSECCSVSDKWRPAGAIGNDPIRREITGRISASPSGGTKKPPALAGHL